MTSKFGIFSFDIHHLSQILGCACIIAVTDFEKDEIHFTEDEDDEIFDQNE